MYTSLNQAVAAERTVDDITRTEQYRKGRKAVAAKTVGRTRRVRLAERSRSVSTTRTTSTAGTVAPYAKRA